jgi:hypothetical protein
VKRIGVFVAVLVMASVAQAGVIAELGEQNISLFDRSNLYRNGSPLTFGTMPAVGDELVTIFNLQPNFSFAWNPLTTEHTGMLTGLKIAGVVDADTWLAPTLATTRVDLYFTPSGRYANTVHANGWAQIFQDEPSPSSKLAWTNLSVKKSRSPTDLNGTYAGSPAIVLNSGATASTAGPFTDGSLFLEGTPVRIPASHSIFLDNNQGGPAGTHPFLGLGYLEMEAFKLPTPDNNSYVGGGIMYLTVTGGSFAGYIQRNTFFPGADVFLQFDLNTKLREGFNLGSDDPMTFNVIPIPEPTSLLLIGGVLAGAAAIRRKRAA